MLCLLQTNLSLCNQSVRQNYRLERENIEAEWYFQDTFHYMSEKNQILDKYFLLFVSYPIFGVVLFVTFYLTGTSTIFSVIMFSAFGLTGTSTFSASS